MRGQPPALRVPLPLGRRLLRDVHGRTTGRSCKAWGALDEAGRESFRSQLIAPGRRAQPGHQRCARRAVRVPRGRGQPPLISHDRPPHPGGGPWVGWAVLRLHPLRSRAPWSDTGCGSASSRRSPRSCRVARDVGGERRDRRAAAASPTSADRLGFDHLTCSEHIAVPPADAAVRGAVYWDPLATLRLHRRPHPPDPAGHLRPGPRLPPPARAGQALRHARSDRGWAARARSRRRHARAPSSSCSARRSPTAASGPTTRCRALRASLGRRRGRVPRLALRLRRPDRGAARPQRARAVLDRGSHAAVAASGGRAGGRVGAVRAVVAEGRRVAGGGRAAGRLRGGRPAAAAWSIRWPTPRRSTSCSAAGPPPGPPWSTSTSCTTRSTTTSSSWRRWRREPGRRWASSR